MKPHESAKAWRLRLGMTRKQLSELSGYSESAIELFEQGARNIRRGEKHSPWSWQRYQMTCAAVNHQLKTGKAFEW